MRLPTPRTHDHAGYTVILITGWLKEGKIRYKEDVVEGLENAPRAFLGLFRGENFGKLLVRVGDDPTRARG